MRVMFASGKEREFVDYPNGTLDSEIVSDFLEWAEDTQGVYLRINHDYDEYKDPYEDCF